MAVNSVDTAFYAKINIKDMKNYLKFSSLFCASNVSSFTLSLKQQLESSKSALQTAKDILTLSSPMEFPILINWTSPCQLKGC